MRAEMLAMKANGMARKDMQMTANSAPMNRTAMTTTNRRMFGYSMRYNGGPVMPSYLPHQSTAMHNGPQTMGRGYPMYSGGPRM